MITRKIIVIDPLPNVANSVKKVLEGISDNDLTVKYLGQADSLMGFFATIKPLLRTANEVGLVLPVNNTADHPLLDDFRRKSGRSDANVYDLLTFVLNELKYLRQDITLPVVMPFLFDFKIERVKAELAARPAITHTLACLVKHISGVDKTFSREQIHKAFYRHFLAPEEKSYMMKDFIPAFLGADSSLV